MDVFTPFYYVIGDVFAFRAHLLDVFRALSPEYGLLGSVLICTASFVTFHHFKFFFTPLLPRVFPENPLFRRFFEFSSIFWSVFACDRVPLCTVTF